MGLDLGPFRLASLTGPYHASVSARFARGTHATQPPPSSSPRQSPTPVRVPVPQLRRRRSGRSRSGAEPPMAEGERELHVRALDGRSTVVALAAAASVRDLKAALRSSFPPAQVSPSFHLFLKGTKLRVEAEIGTLAVGEGEFIVLVPFARKSQQCSPVAMAEQGQITESPRSSQVSTGANSARRGITDNLSSIPSSPHAETASRYFSSGANSAWQEIMDDLSSISSSPQDDSASKNFCAQSTIPCSGNSVEDVSTDQRLPTGNSNKRRKPCKENGNAFNEMPTSGANSAAGQPSIDKKSSIARSAATSCHGTCHLGPAEMVDHLKQGLGKEGQIVHIEEIPCRAASFAELPNHLSEATREALKSIGVSRLYSHQALAQDQLRSLLEMKNALHTDIDVNIYDGDTPREDRTWIRDNARLSFHFCNTILRYIVIDEAHSYKGAFGCHTALILRRLKRICSNIYGSHPTFIFCTATSANPREHVMELAKLDNVELIENDGSPCGFKYFLLWNPPLHMTKEGSSKDSLLTRRSSPIVEVSYLLSEMVQHGLRCIAFCKTRKLCELVLAYTREILQETAKELVDTICVYRAGYIAEDRRKIEANLFQGKLLGVAATNALELGIDVGHIDATLHLGFPGSIASLWQQAGRSGRRAKQSLAIYVAFEGPLDQYFMKFPHKLFGKPIEHCQVDSHNQKLLEQHLACAAYEHPLCVQYDADYFCSSLNSVMMTLKDKGCLINNPSGPFSSSMWSYIGPEKRPSQAVSIRAIEHDKYRVIDKLNNRLLEEIEESKAFFQVYDGAVYMHQGVNYLVEELDLSSRTAFCRKADLKYYTKTRDYTDINVLGGEFAHLPPSMCKTNGVKTTAQANDCKVTTKWFGFYRIWKSNNKISDSIELNLPPYSFNSQAVWVRIPHSVKTNVEERKLQFRGGSHAASHALLNIVPLHMTCNASDLGTECANPHETRGIPDRILLYDKHPGGIGIALQIKSLFGELLLAALELVSECNCTSSAGCPNCIQTLTCGEYNEVLDKEAAILILKGVIEYERSYFEKEDGSDQGVR
uniref:Helicase C-terminal domain-containing protein n=1 Tax=Oryza nivara TaxID=4536 RepID=A0A0E0I3H4_ORYNI